MRYLLLSFFLFLNLAFALDSVRVSDKSITLHTYGYFTTDRELSPHEALRTSQKIPLSQLPKSAQSFGFDGNTYWFVFEVSTRGEEDYVLGVTNIVASSCDMFVFDNEKLISQQVNGYNVPIDKREIPSLALRFKLEKKSSHLTYLVKIHSKNPHYSAFEFGKRESVDAEWDTLVFITTAALAISAVMIFYNLALFFAIRDITYLYYCLYIGSYAAFNLSVLGFLPLISPVFSSIELRIPVGVFLQLMYIGLTLFTIKFLQLDKNDPKLKKQLLYILYFMVISTFLIPLNKGLELLAVFSMAALAFFLIYSVIKTYLRGYKPALFYLIATGVAILFNMLFMNMNQGGGVPYNLWTFNLVSFGLMWDIVFLSFAIAHRIHLLQEENLKNERLGLMKSRQKVIGELTGNIAHQWRQPLSALGAIIATVEGKIKYSHLSHEELIESCKLSTSILQHLSGTINTLQDFFIDHADEKENFDLNVQIAHLIYFLEDSMTHENITLNFIPHKTLFIHSNKNLLSQVMMNILLNAKDILIENNQEKEKVINLDTAIIEGKVIITIEDNGGGIKIDPVEKIFNPFVSGKSNGSGIGLYMTKNIVEKLGGEISASNTKEGAKFTIVLPH